MRTSQNLFENKIAIIRGATDVFARHGNGFDLKIRVSLLVVDIEVLRMNNGSPDDRRLFSVECQQGDACYRLAEKGMEEALQKLGVEFVSLNQMKEEANG